MTAPRCIECGSVSEMVGGEVIYPHRPDLFAKNFYLCGCGAYCGAHHGTTKALGFPCGPRTRRARSAAHKAFDPLWRGKRAQFRRNEAYAWLADKMGLEREECHIGMMDAEQTMQVVRICYGRAQSVKPHRRSTPASRSQRVFVGKTKRASNWVGKPTPSDCPPWEVQA